jgi:hypothetical protein
MRRQKSVETERVPFTLGKGGPFIQPGMDEEVVSGEAYFHGLLFLEFEQDCRVLAITLATTRGASRLEKQPTDPAAPDKLSAISETGHR